MKGKCESFYKFRVLCESGGQLLYRQSTDITAEIGIPKTSIYAIINCKPRHKWLDFIIEKCRVPVFEQRMIDYPIKSSISD
jgi:hypothetical protein